MGVQFILGRSGVGKSQYCLNAIIDCLIESSDDGHLVLLVPEQATYQAERAILSDGRIAGYNRLHVVSFERLQFLVCGKNTVKPAISPIGRQMIVHKILRQNKDKLSVLSSSATLPGLARQMADTIAEFCRYSKTPEHIDEFLVDLQSGEQDKLTTLKFSDVNLVFKEYLKFTQDKFLDADNQLANAREILSEVDFLKGAKFWVDGFSGFTLGEFELLAELLKITKDSQIALCLDPAEIDLAKPVLEAGGLSMFYPTQRTYTELFELVTKSKLKLHKPVILNESKRFSLCLGLEHLERNIFANKPAKLSAAESIRIISAPSLRAEVRFVAKQILQLVKKKGFRYRDIAVIASDFDRYEHYMRAYFEDYGVPFFIDKPKALNCHPLVGLISSTLQAIMNDFSCNDIFSYLKTDLGPIECDDVDLLENYCLAFGIGGSNWQSSEEWVVDNVTNSGFDQQRINQLRRGIIEPLIKLRDKLCPDDTGQKTITAREFTKAVFDFLESLQVRQKLQSRTEEAMQNNEQGAADEHRQLYGKVVDLFDELVVVFDEQELTCRDLYSILSAAFSQITMAFIPPTLDQVLVGSIERSRHPNLKAVFLVGATEKQFPSSIKFQSLLTDTDRDTAEKFGLEVAPSNRQTLLERQYLAYIAFTRASNFLYVSYPAVGERGSAVVRSTLLDNVESLFENLCEESIGSEQAGIDSIDNQGELADFLCSEFGKNSDIDRADLLEKICADSQLCQSGKNVRRAINYDNKAQLDKKVIGKIFSTTMQSSATRLTTFAQCPYKYFARYVLRLKERQEFKLRPLDIGSFYHNVLDVFTKQLLAEGKNFSGISDEELLKIFEKTMSKAILEEPFISNFACRTGHNAFIIQSAQENLQSCVIAIAQMIRAGRFKPCASEIGFGKSDEGLGLYEIQLDDGRQLILRGKIDRLDIAESDGQKIALIFDYKKRNANSFNWAGFYYGLDLQLPVYMLAVRNTSNPKYKMHVVAGGFNIPIEVGTEKLSFEKLAEKSEKFNYKAKGIFDGRFASYLDSSTTTGNSQFYNYQIKDGQPYGSYVNRGALKPTDFENLLKFAERKIIELAKRIFAGEISIKPYYLKKSSPCKNCIYRPVCRFDWQINDYNFLEPTGKLNVVEKIGGGNG